MTDYGKPNGHGWMMDFVRDNQDLIRDINVDFPPHLERMIARLNVIMQDLPRQQEIAATFARGTPSLEWLVASHQSFHHSTRPSQKASFSASGSIAYCSQREVNCLRRYGRWTNASRTVSSPAARAQSPTSW
jgi:hypothetical protein